MIMEIKMIIKSIMDNQNHQYFLYGNNVSVYQYYMGHATFLLGLDMSYMNKIFNIIESWY